MTLTVDFLNVGQGDCTLIRESGGVSVLVDGGVPKAIEKHLDFLRSLPKIDLLIGTHGDLDHLGGLCVLVEDPGCPPIGKALLPPFPTPGGKLVPVATSGSLVPRMSPFAAHAISELGLDHVLSPLEELASEFDLAQEVRGAAIENEWETPAEAETELRAFSSDATSELSFPALRELTDAAAGVPGEIVAEVLYPEASSSRRAITASRTSLFRAALEVASDAEALTTLERLLVALKAKGIPWEVRCAPKQVSGDGDPLEAWHLAPTEEYAGQIAKHLKGVRSPLYLARAVRRGVVFPGLPSYANRMSHVISFRSKSGGPGIMITGDSGFQKAHGKTPESMSIGWERTLEWARLISVPHHGGTSGHFGKRLLAGLGSAASDPLDMYLSVGYPNEHAPPYSGFDTLLPEVRLGCSRLRLHMSAIPREEAIGPKFQHLIKPADMNPGPARIQLENSSGQWLEGSTSDTLVLEL